MPSAIGARTSIKYAEETIWGNAITLPTKAIEVTSESFKLEITDLRSTALRSDRDIHKRVRGISTVSGDLAFEQNVDGFGTLYSHALGRHITISNADGGVRCQMASTCLATAKTLVTTAIPTGFPAVGGQISVVYYDANGNLATVIGNVASHTVAAPWSFTLDIQIGVALAIGDYIFLQDSTNYTGVYTHYIEAADELPVGLTFEIVRDIAVFSYAGVKINTLEETYKSGEMLSGTFGCMGKSEWCGDWLTVIANPGDLTLTVEDNSGFPTAGTVSVGTEFDITYTGKGPTTLTGVPAVGNPGAITAIHAIGTIVSLQKTAAPALTYSSQEQISSFSARVYFDGTSQEVLSATWNLNNNLYGDKVPLGSHYRAMLPEQDRTVEGSINVEFDDMTLYSRYIKETQVKLEIRCILNTEIGATGVYLQKHVIMPKIEHTGSTPTAGGKGLITYDMPFVSMYDDTTDKPSVVVIIVNDESSI